MKCQAEGCICPIEARPFKLESSDCDRFLGCFCPCHSIALYLAILKHDPDAEVSWLEKFIEKGEGYES